MYSTNKNTAPEKSKIQIAKNQCYELLHDRTANRLYFAVNGFWKNREVVAGLLDDWRKALNSVQPHFTLLLDLRSMITHPQHLNSLHLEVYQLIKEAGLHYTACVGPEDRIATLQVEEIIRKSEFPVKNFATCQEADSWLNSLSGTYTS
ncbi:MAG: hypothetical protein LPK07_02015 [Hymenobacteraceae bacterium]|nr:hypothetical protein [Hymenobacteraceae bacterium]